MNEAGVCSQVSIVVASCDDYSDLWIPFFYLLRKNWTELRLKTYLITNHRKVDLPGVTSLSVGSDVTWSANLKVGLQLLSEPYVLLLLEDLFVLRPIDSRQLFRVLDRIIEIGGDCVKLNPVPPPDMPYDEVMGAVSPGLPYRVSTVATVWRRELLIHLLEPSENAWQFELNGSARSNPFLRFYACHRHEFPVTNAVVRGKWRKNALRATMLTGAPVDRLARPVMDTWESATYGLAVLRYHALQSMPPKWRSPIRAFWCRS